MSSIDAPTVTYLPATLVLAFVVSAWYTIRLSLGMTMATPDSSMMPVSANWTLLTFSTMWLLMMVAMMLPSCWPTVSSFRRVATLRREPYIDALALLMMVGYFVAWMAFGLLVFALGREFLSRSTAGFQFSRMLSSAVGGGLLLVGLYQLSPWKARFLDHCRDPLHFFSFQAGSGWLGAFRAGLMHGSFCVGCCAGLMFVQLLLGVMSLPVMVATAAVIAAEKLLPRPALVAKGVGIVAVSAGAALLARGPLLF